MIKQIFDITLQTLASLPENHYTARIKSHFDAYGTSYDFCRFFVISQEKLKALICIFNSTMVVSICENEDINDEIIRELSLFARMNKPNYLEGNSELLSAVFDELADEYSLEKRTLFEFENTTFNAEEAIDDNPKLDEVYKILAKSFPSLKDCYDLWLTDTSHRIRRGMSQVFLYKNCSTLTVQYMLSGKALIGHVATSEENRGRNYARELIYHVASLLKKQGLTAILFARENRVSYYKEIGFKAVFTDIVLERKP